MIFLYSSSDGDALDSNKSWEQWSDYSWNTLLKVWQVNIDMAIFPIVDVVTGINEIDFINGVKLSTFPNPAVDILTLSYSLQKNSGNVQIAILNSEGRVVSRIEEGSKQAGKYNRTIDVHTFHAGIYYVTINSGGGRLATKLVIQYLVIFLKTSRQAYHDTYWKEG